MQGKTYCMKPPKFKANNCALFSIMCLECYVFPLTIVETHGIMDREEWLRWNGTD